MKTPIQVLTQFLRTEVAFRNALTLSPGIDWKDVEEIDVRIRETNTAIKILESWEVKEPVV